MDLGIGGKVALVTASSRGLGRASAQALAAEGVRVVISARGEDSLRQAEASIRASGAEVHAVAADVTDPAVPARLVEETRHRFGSLDILVANAGGPPPGRALDVTDAQIAAALNANLTTSVRLVRGSAAAPAGRGMGPHLLHRVVLGQAAHTDPRSVQSGPDRPVGLGQDRGR